jgi:hypothetical protein
VIGSLVSGGFVFFALLSIFTSSPRWDDHLINAAGVFAAGLFVSFALRLATAALRPQAAASKRTRFVRLLWLVAFAALVFGVVKVAMFIDGMSFL